jgi:hypothetical protein
VWVTSSEASAPGMAPMAAVTARGSPCKSSAWEATVQWGVGGGLARALVVSVDGK